MKKTMIKLLIMFVIFSIITACETLNPSLLIVRLPVNPDKPLLVDDSGTNEVVLIIQHYRWVLWATTARYLVGEITEDEYNEKKETILNIISQLEATD